MITVNFWTWLPVLTMLALLPVMCYYDWKIREIPDWCFLALAVVGSITIVIQYIFLNVYGIEEILITGMLVVMYYLIARLAPDYFHGDDLLLMWCISIFCVVNPLKPDSGDLAVTTTIFLIPVLITAFFIMLIPACVRWCNKFPSIETIISDAVECGGKFPLVIPIAVAFILAVVL